MWGVRWQPNHVMRCGPRPGMCWQPHLPPHALTFFIFESQSQEHPVKFEEIHNSCSGTALLLAGALLFAGLLVTYPTFVGLSRLFPILRREIGGPRRGLDCGEEGFARIQELVLEIYL